MPFALFRAAVPRVLVAAAAAATLTTGSLAAAAVPASATPAPATVSPAAPARPVHQAAPALPAHAVVLGAEAAARPLELTVILPPSDPAALTRLADAVSEPGSAQYHRYLAPGEFASRFGATPAQVARVRQELAAAGMHPGSLGADRLSLTVRTTAAVAARAFHTSIHAVRAGGRTAYANTTGAVLPAGIAGVAGLDNLVQAHDNLVVAPRTALSLPPTLCSATGQRAFAYAPAQVAAAYSFGAAYAASLDGTGQTVGLLELADYANSDLATYESCLGLSNQSVQRVPVDGGASQGDGTSEATYDVEQVMANAPGASILVYEGSNTDQGLLDVYSRMVNDDKASVISTSWGLCEALNDPSLMSAENTLFQQAAAQGQTVLAASGDSGSEDCYPVDRDQTLGVDDPASQPYVTGVGGTSLTSTSPRSETVWNSGGGATGGGISSIWPMPMWQWAVASSQSSGAPCGLSRGDCREVPDVSASADPAHGYSGYCTAGDCGGGGWRSAGGTSLAAPLWAAVVALANQACPTSHRAGFINPVLYQSGAAAMNDVTSGNNDLLGTNGGSFGAGPGYDMASGLGTPQASALLPVLCPAAPGGSGSSGGGGVNPTPPNQPATGPAAEGYRFVAADGGVFNFGTSTYLGSAAGVPLTSPIVGMAPTPDGGGYWLVASDGGVFAYGDAVFHGSAGGIRLSRPIVGMAADPATGGYWLVAADGGIFSYDAPFFGSTGAIRLSRPIVGMAASPTGRGYRFVASDGGVFSFGDAAFYGSTGALHLAAPVVGLSTTSDGLGYWLVASDGGVFSFGDARFLGSTGGLHLTAPIVGVAGA